MSPPSPPARSLRPRLEPQPASPVGDRPGDSSGIPGGPWAGCQGAPPLSHFPVPLEGWVGFVALRATRAAPRLWPHPLDTRPPPPTSGPRKWQPSRQYCPARAGCQELGGGGARCLAKRAGEEATGLGRQGSGIRGCPETDSGGWRREWAPRVESTQELATGNGGRGRTG